MFGHKVLVWRTWKILFPPLREHSIASPQFPNLSPPSLRFNFHKRASWISTRPYKDIVQHFLRKSFPSLRANCLGILVVSDITNPTLRMIPKPATHDISDPIAAGLKFFANDPLVAKPGTKFSYSTQGFTLIGCVIEGASNQKYMDYMLHNVFGPAHMPQTVEDDLLTIIPYRTRFYQVDQAGKVQNADLLDPSYKVPGGGWLSSADDMARFELAILGNRLVSQASRDLMWTRQRTADGKETDYGLGWGIGRQKEIGMKDVGHGGGQQGTSTFMMLVPERQAGVVVLINMNNVDASGLATDLMKIVLSSASQAR